MITIKMNNNKWQVEITKETWEFKDLNELNIELKEVLEMKDKFGRIR